MPYVWNAKWDKELEERGLEAVRNALAHPTTGPGDGAEPKGFPGHNRAYMEWWVQRQLAKREQKAKAKCAAFRKSEGLLKIDIALIGSVVSIFGLVTRALAWTAVAAVLAYFVTWIR